MRKQLLLKMPLTETYQGCAFINGIILSRPNLENFVINNYYNLACKKSDDMHEIVLQFPDLLWDDISRENLAEVKAYHVRDLPKESIGEFLREAIDRNKYIAIYKIDEYYLSYTSHFSKEHFIHDIYIYGYNDDNFNVMAYKDKKLSLFEVPGSEIEAGLLGAAWVDDDANFSTILINEDAKVEIDIRRIARELDCYINNIRPEHNNEVLIYGSDIYEILIKCLKIIAFLGEKRVYEIDLRAIRIILEHKKMLLRNISLLTQYYPINSILIEQLKEIREIAKKVWFLALKHSARTEAKTVNKMLILVSDMRKKERIVLESIRNALNEFASNN